MSREFSNLIPFGTVIFDTLAVILKEEERNRWRKFFPDLKMQFGRFIELSGNRCANTNIH